MIEIDTQGTTFYSQRDEMHFFTWAQEIESVKSIDRGIFHFDSNEVPDEDLRDLIALLFRYGIPMRELHRFCNSANEEWFKNENMFWYRHVFQNV